MALGGLFGGADTEMEDDSHLAGSPAATPYGPAQTYSLGTQCSIDEWIDRLRINNPLTQDLATVNMLMTALNLTKDQATTAIMEALNEGDEDKDTDISRFQQVQDSFPDNFQKFLEVNDVSFPSQHENWEAFSNSFNEHAEGIARHVDFKINPARKHRLGHKANGLPRDPPRGRLMNSETVTLSHLNIFPASPVIKTLLELGRRVFNWVLRASGTEILHSDPRDNLTQGWVQDRLPSPYYVRRHRTRPCMTYTLQGRDPSIFRDKNVNLPGIYTTLTC